jgi:hypothetical protein
MIKNQGQKLRKNQKTEMYPYVRINWNAISWGKDFILDELQPIEKPDSRIKRIEIKLRLEVENWIQKTASERWIGDLGGEKTEKELPGFVRNTKHDPLEEGEEDQIDTSDLKINPAETKTVPTDAQIPGARIDAQGESDVTGANRGVRSTFESRPSRGILQ